MTRGLFLVLEGIEGCGKTTQAKRLESWLESRGLPFMAVREPGGTAVGEEVRRLLLDGGVVDDRTELLLLLSARAALVQDVIEPAVADGRIVVGDRYSLSTFAYQAHGRGLDLETVRKLNAFATGGLWPDLTIVLDVPRATSEERRSARSRDRIERAGSGFHDRVAAAYAELARSEPDVRVLDATGSPAAVHAALVGLLEGTFPETFARRQG